MTAMIISYTLDCKNSRVLSSRDIFDNLRGVAALFSSCFSGIVNQENGQCEGTHPHCSKRHWKTSGIPIPRNVAPELKPRESLLWFVVTSEIDFATVRYTCLNLGIIAIFSIQSRVSIPAKDSSLQTLSYTYWWLVRNKGRYYAGIYSQTPY